MPKALTPIPVFETEPKIFPFNKSGKKLNSTAFGALAEPALPVAPKILKATVMSKALAKSLGSSASPKNPIISPSNPTNAFPIIRNVFMISSETLPNTSATCVGIKE